MKLVVLGADEILVKESDALKYLLAIGGVGEGFDIAAGCFAPVGGDAAPKGGGLRVRQQLGPRALALENGDPLTADDGFTLFHLLYNMGDKVGVDSAVRVHADENVAGGFPNGEVPAGRLDALRIVQHPAGSKVRPLGKVLQDRLGPIGRTAVDHKNFDFVVRVILPFQIV